MKNQQAGASFCTPSFVFDPFPKRESLFTGSLEKLQATSIVMI